MIATAKLFKNGQSQAVRFPKEFRFDNLKEVFIKKANGMVVLIPKDNKTVWDTMYSSLDNFFNDFMEDRIESK